MKLRMESTTGRSLNSYANSPMPTTEKPSNDSLICSPSSSRKNSTSQGPSFGRQTSYLQKLGLREITVEVERWRLPWAWSESGGPQGNLRACPGSTVGICQKSFRFPSFTAPNPMASPTNLRSSMPQPESQRTCLRPSC